MRSRPQADWTVRHWDMRQSNFYVCLARLLEFDTVSRSKVTDSAVVTALGRISSATPETVSLTSKRIEPSIQTHACDMIPLDGIWMTEAGIDTVGLDGPAWPCSGFGPAPVSHSLTEPIDGNRAWLPVSVFEPDYGRLGREGQRIRFSWMSNILSQHHHKALYRVIGFFHTLLLHINLNT